MMRISTPGGVSAAIALALAVTGCSSAPTTGGGGDFGGGTGQTGGGNTTSGGGGSSTGSGSPTTGGGASSNSGSSKSSGATAGSTGSNSNTSGTSGTGTNTGSTPSSGAPAPSSTSGSGSTPGMMTSTTPGSMGTSTGTGTSGTPTGSTGSPNQGGPNGIPTAQGFTTGPTATDLTAPPTGVGIQFGTPAGAYTVQPGQEIFPNYCVTVPNDFQVGGFQSFMTAGSSHHFILYNGGTVAAGTPDGQCSGAGHNWMYATSTPGAVVTENFPPNVGLDLPANTQLVINMHFINPGSTPSSPQVKMNLLAAQNVMYQAGTMVSFNVQINVPAATAAGPGTQTVSGTCTAPTGANFFSMSTHTHKHATDAWITYTHNGETNEIVHTGMVSTYPADQEPGSGTDWEHPGVGLWVAPNYLTVQAGDSFGYNCSYVNTDTTTAVTVGETAASNEMCMAIGYYFPAGSAFCQ